MEDVALVAILGYGKQCLPPEPLLTCVWATIQITSTISRVLQLRVRKHWTSCIRDEPKFRGLCSSAGAIEGRGHRAQRRWQARSCSAIWRADAPCLQVIPLDPAKSQPNEAIAGCRADRTRELPPSLWHLRFDYRTKDSVVNSWHLSPVALRVRSMRGGLARDLTV